ncbi:MAG: PrsW family intramembrane metalloprotease [Theionarchaea archaeon]|nr:PrsW family intramembrane metalloprotease [Theionarchaea archaeon]
MIEYLILAFAPGIFWMWFFWRKDTYDREPLRLLLRTFILGAAVVVPVAGVEELFVFGEGIIAMMMVGIFEETAKFLPVVLYVYKRPEFDEVMDGIIYATAASLGFASLENLFYILSFGPSVMIGRAILSTLGHVLFSSFWGYSLGLKKITGKNTVLVGLIGASVAHGIYNIVLMAQFWFVNILAIPFMWVLYSSMTGKIKQSLKMSPFRRLRRQVTPSPARSLSCPSCGITIPHGAKFCPRCGSSVLPATEPLLCPQCGTALPPGSVFCPQCGKKII